MKITVFYVSDIQKPYFEKFNQYNYELNLVSKRLSLETVDLSKDSDGVLIQGGCDASQPVVEKLAEYGIKYLYSRSVGINNIDLATAKKHNILVANVPNYSPRAVGEMAMTMGLTLFRKLAQASYYTANGDFMVKPAYFAKEIRDATVGIIGAGTIGMAEAKLYHALGAKVIAYNRHPKDSDVVDFVDLKTLLKESDIISVHIPYVPNLTENFIGEDEIKQMKDDAILVNTARGQVVDNQAIANAIQNKELGGFGTDVLIDEENTMARKFDSIDEIPSPINQQLIKEHPNVIVTPHIGFFTEEAVSDMVTISYENFEQTLKTGQPVNPVQ